MKLVEFYLMSVTHAFVFSLKGGTLVEQTQPHLDRIRNTLHGPEHKAPFLVGSQGKNQITSQCLCKGYL